MIYVGLNAGKIEVTFQGIKEKFPLMETAADHIVSLMIKSGLEGFYNSSSYDFPKENGFRGGFDHDKFEGMVFDKYSEASETFLRNHA